MQKLSTEQNSAVDDDFCDESARGINNVFEGDLGSCVLAVLRELDQSFRSLRLLSSPTKNNSVALKQKLRQRY
jgi:hypothetical protein